MLKQIRVGVDGYMGAYYCNHWNRTRLKEVKIPEGSYVWDGCDYMCIVEFLMHFGSFLLCSSPGDRVQDLELMVKIG